MSKFDPDWEDIWTGAAWGIAGFSVFKLLSFIFGIWVFLTIITVPFVLLKGCVSDALEPLNVFKTWEIQKELWRNAEIEEQKRNPKPGSKLWHIQKENGRRMKEWVDAGCNGSPPKLLEAEFEPTRW